MDISISFDHIPVARPKQTLLNLILVYFSLADLANIIKQTG